MSVVPAIVLSTAWALVSAAAKSPPDPLTELLREEIVGQTLPLAEVQRYCDPRIPRLELPGTAAAWQAEVERLRAAMFQRVVFRGAAAAWRQAPQRVEWAETLPGGPGYRLKKVKYEALPGMWIPAILYEPEKLSGRVPVSLAVNGHVGNPGKAVDYKQLRCINQAKRGMLVLNVEWLGMGQLNAPGFGHAKMNQLDLCGASGLAPFYLSMERGLDLLLSLPHADPRRVVVSGLSGGGWQTIFISALDPRVTVANPVAGYSSFATRVWHQKDLGDSEQTPCDMATVADYMHLTAMRAPRPTLLTFNSKDQCCFESGYALPPLFEAARPAFALFGKAAALQTHVNDDPGTHNYELDNRLAFYRLLQRSVLAGDPTFDATEIPSADEVKTKQELLVPIEQNEDFNTLARSLAKELPRQSALPADRAAALAWQDSSRQRLRQITAVKTYQAQGVVAQRKTWEGHDVVFWRFVLGEWSVPGVEFAAAAPTETVLLVADAGRASSAATIKALLKPGRRVVAVDPFHIGESLLPRKQLYPLLIAALGDRPIGIQAGQLVAVASCLQQRYSAPVRLVSVGPRSQLMTLVAAAVEPSAIAGVENREGQGSLKELLEKDVAVTDGPELFCFGLLEAFDLVHIAALVAPRPVILEQPTDRARQEFAPLAGWREMLKP